MQDILYDKALCVIGGGVVLNPKAILEEIAELKANGKDVDRLRIDERTHVVMPYHIVLDGLNEKLRGKGDIGTTKRGIGPCYTDKAERSGIRMIDLIKPEIFAEKLKAALTVKNEIITKVFGCQSLDLTRYITNTKVMPHSSESTLPIRRLLFIRQ